MQKVSGIAKSPTTGEGRSRTERPDLSSTTTFKKVARDWIGGTDYHLNKRVQTFVLDELLKQKECLTLDELHTRLRQTNQLILMPFLPFALRALCRRGNNQKPPELVSVVRRGFRCYFLNPEVLT